MPIIKSAGKRVRTAEKATVRNAKTRRAVKSATKAFNKSLDAGQKDASQLQQKAQSELGKAAKKHVMHKNKLARKQSQLAKAAGVKPPPAKKSSSAGKPKTTTAKSTSTKKPAAKKTAAKKTPAKSSSKKPAAKKSSLKKPAGKK
ncbi:MAG: 30S ribosomal protein S20 [Candidatus Saccharimonadales bacterium]